MRCSSLFVAALVITLGFYAGKEFNKLLDFDPGPGFNRRKLLYYAGILAMLVYIAWTADNTFISLS